MHIPRHEFWLTGLLVTQIECDSCFPFFSFPQCSFKHMENPGNPGKQFTMNYLFCLMWAVNAFFWVWRSHLVCARCRNLGLKSQPGRRVYYILIHRWRSWERSGQSSLTAMITSITAQPFWNLGSTTTSNTMVGKPIVSEPWIPSPNHTFRWQLATLLFGFYTNHRRRNLIPRRKWAVSWKALLKFLLCN